MPESIPFPLAATLGGTLSGVIVYLELQRRGVESDLRAMGERYATQTEKTVSALERVVELVKGIKP